MAAQEGISAYLRDSEVTIVDPQGGDDQKSLQENFDHALEGIRANVCPVRDIIERISDKWSLLTILLLGANDTLRFSQIKRQIGDVSQRMLTVTLKHLEEDGFISRHAYAEVPPRVEYALTPIGRELLEHVRLFTGWIDQNKDRILAARKMQG